MPGQHKVPGVVVRYHAQFSAARFKSSKRKITSKAAALGTLHCQLKSGYRKGRRKGIRSIHMVPLHGNSMCASLVEKRRKGRKEENAAGQYTESHK